MKYSQGAFYGANLLPYICVYIGQLFTTINGILS